MKKHVSLFFIFLLLFSCAKNSNCVGLNAIYVSNNDPQFIALCAVGAALAGAGIYAKSIPGLFAVVGGVSLILGSKEILLAFNKKIMQHQLATSKKTAGEKIKEFFS